MPFTGMLLLTSAAMLAPILLALFAAALAVPRILLGWYAFYAIAAILVFGDLGDAREDAGLTGLGAFLFQVLGAAIVGLLTRCVLEVVRRAGDGYLRPSRFSIASQMRSSKTTLSKRLISCRPVGEVTLISVR